MTIIVGYATDERGGAALNLGVMLARSSGEDLLVTCVVPAPWVPGMARIDAEYRSALNDTADSALDQARAGIPADVPARFVRHSARSAPVGLLELAARRAADLVVLGSSSAGGFGHIALGSVSDRLLHSSPVPLAVAPRGYRCRPGGTVDRVTVAYGESSQAESLVVAAGSVAALMHAALRIASFAVWSRPDYTTTLGTDSEDLVLQEWTEKVRQSAGAALAQVQELAEVPHDVETVIGRGRSWVEAIDDVGWRDGDVLVMGSSELGPAARVFLGSRATKIMRHSPVPVVVVPRQKAEELADRAVRT
ncbi:universal stress protein [Nocardioides iriomotensis]|uniref:Universal stress protein n=1 Tax=Nocardioides iriomotensis TaxID=715784 RepID=A0A4Q5IUV4_9ACTN|nr:universal stress protein [Nocardioides iriomotensis]RYU09684.1 universal stress protein [Nocardioides iriomotensis]